MELFWARGYEGAQLTDLTAAIGINPPSFYAAFGSKEAAFREALELYERKMGSRWGQALAGDLDTRQSIRALLDYTVELALGAPGSGGCMMALGMINAMPGHEALRDLLRDRRREGVRQVRNRLEKGVRDGDLPPSTDLSRLAVFFCGILQAISLQARDGATRKELDDIVVTAMMALPEPHIQPRSAKATPARRRKPGADAG
ncbi:MAG TPA: TetR/AcrR family transcriptional regulator [Phenylobacterium sp.]|uniref:TetR/AcrR family transcriptional regulator n=1 Tax=Phenylobacterium sp. TaxID=1871053 RepID=UPI002B481983|nr:TetR/AcrR family transcriptional regulator [Phenylobacterium sp.]HKR86730.1 TetR/AcrR family transcriptional regulator [Phenylobacterium sp.]